MMGWKSHFSPSLLLMLSERGKIKDAYFTAPLSDFRSSAVIATAMA